MRLLLAAVSCAVVLAAWGGIRAGGVNEGLQLTRPNALLLATTIGAAAMTGFATWAAISRGRSMRGRRLEWLAAVAILTPLALLAWKAGVSMAFDGMTQVWPERVGLRCMRLGLMAATPPLAALLFLPGSIGLQHARATGLALGVAAGAWAWVAIDLWCPVAHLPHLLLGHVVPLAAAALAGWLLAPLRR